MHKGLFCNFMLRCGLFHPYCVYFFCSMNSDRQSILNASWWDNKTQRWWEENQSCRIYILSQMLQEKKCNDAFWKQCEQEFKATPQKRRNSLLENAQCYLAENSTLQEMKKLKLHKLWQKWQANRMLLVVNNLFVIIFVYICICFCV